MRAACAVYSLQYGCKTEMEKGKGTPQADGFDTLKGRRNAGHSSGPRCVWKRGYKRCGNPLVMERGKAPPPDRRAGSPGPLRAAAASRPRTVAASTTRSASGSAALSSSALEDHADVRAHAAQLNGHAFAVGRAPPGGHLADVAHQRGGAKRGLFKGDHAPGAFGGDLGHEAQPSVPRMQWGTGSSRPSRVER